MLNDILLRLERELPPDSLHADVPAWPGLAGSFCGELEVVVQKLLATAARSLPTRIFKESKQEYLVPQRPVISVAEFRLRPQTTYFTRMRRHPPRPESTKGNDATGLEFSLNLFRGYSSGASVRRPSMSVEFQIWGEYERTRFHDLLRDHRYLVEQFVLASCGAFSTSCVFENVDLARKATAFDLLCLYYENDHDPENAFTIECEFGPSADEADILHALLPLLALYDATMGYCLPKKYRSRLLDHLGVVR